MQTIDKTKVDEIIDGLLGNNDLIASPEVWYGLHRLKNLPVTEIITCGECAYREIRGVDGFCDHITGEPIMVKRLIIARGRKGEPTNDEVGSRTKRLYLQ